MRRLSSACSGLLGLVLLAGAARGAGLDWEVHEADRPPAAVAALRNVRDGVLGMGDAVLEANTSLFGEVGLLIAKLTMAASDGVGLVDDNPVSEHVTHGFASKHLARTAYFWHVAGSESLLGGHGLEVERWAIGDVARLNPLLGETDVEALSGPLPLDPLDFFEDGFVHANVYRTHSFALGVSAIVASDGLLRPLGSLLRVLQLPSWGRRLEERGNSWFRSAARGSW